MSILEMAISLKYIIREELLQASAEKDVSLDDIIVSLMADLQQKQDEETRTVFESLPGKVIKYSSCKFKLRMDF